MRPSIVVVGSADPDREYTPAMQEIDLVPAACEAVGRELARAGCDLVVFSSSDDYIEKDVVRGYLGALETQDGGSVVVKAPFDRVTLFDVPSHLKYVLRVEPDPAEEWEVSYYRAVFEADGLIVVGGGRATRIAGVLAVARRIPLVAMARFGGAALSVWRHLDRYHNDATPEAISRMAAPWGDDAAAQLVRSLLDQQSVMQEAERAARREQSRARRARTRHSLIAVLAIISAVLSVVLAYGTETTATAVGYLISGSLLMAAAGALINDASAEEPNLAWALARGLGAGTLASMLYVGSQTLTNAEPLDAEASRRLAWLLIPLGLAAGYTVDKVFARLRNVDALAEKPFTQP
ncbi:hypothetical protein JOD64_005420 [Micromonospora luteifusca]|uniref:Uncharacterized protein n=1 Tax=Micromonospora luteifusca TaxID=709860 RepID=A0ABS2M2H6_9ACTN|nr:hypothetical protein [Micromonospora luteifusca]MBM7494198.1 hypothetical protein [Micromonospora luteifusca]